MRAPTSQRGFTLVELVMTIVILGIVGTMVASFMRGPIDAYFDSGRRAALTDVADTTMRRLARDLRKALPNSVRVPNAQCLEFIPTKTGGRYRDDSSAAGLSFNAADTTFNMLGSNVARPASERVVAGDVVVVYNLGPLTGADAYSGDNTSVIASVGAETGTPLETPITIASKLFPLESGSRRFHIVPATERVVSYVCSGGNLTRTVNAVNFTSSCPATGPIIARNIDTCSFAYSGSDLQRNAAVQMRLQLTDKGETVTLQDNVNINNTP